MEDAVIGPMSYWRDDASDDTIFITVENHIDIVKKIIEFDELYEDIIHLFVNQKGFSFNSLVVTKETIKIVDDGVMVQSIAKVTFVNDGIIMAKLQGILE